MAARWFEALRLWVQLDNTNVLRELLRAFNHGTLNLFETGLAHALIEAAGSTREDVTQSGRIMAVLDEVRPFALRGSQGLEPLQRSLRAKRVGRHKLGCAAILSGGICALTGQALSVIEGQWAHIFRDATNDNWGLARVI